MDTTEEEFIRNVQAEEHSEKLQAVSKTEVECWCDSFFSPTGSELKLFWDPKSRKKILYGYSCCALPLGYHCFKPHFNPRYV